MVTTADSVFRIIIKETACLSISMSFQIDCPALDIPFKSAYSLRYLIQLQWIAFLKTFLASRRYFQILVEKNRKCQFSTVRLLIQLRWSMVSPKEWKSQLSRTMEFGMKSTVYSKNYSLYNYLVHCLCDENIHQLNYWCMLLITFFNPWCKNTWWTTLAIRVEGHITS